MNIDHPIFSLSIDRYTSRETSSTSNSSALASSSSGLEKGTPHGLSGEKGVPVFFVRRKLVMSLHILNGIEENDMYLVLS